MPTYISLIRFTQQGMQNIKEAPFRVTLSRKGFAPMAGVEVKQFYFVMGQYDAVAIVEAESEEAVAKLLLTIGSFGNVRTESFRAFTEEEARTLVAALP